MPAQVHGLLPDHSPAVLLILDMISDFQFPDGAQVQRAARRVAPRIAALKRRAKAAHLACLYVNDNPGRWRSDSHALIAHCLQRGAAGADVVRRVLRSLDVIVPSACVAAPTAAETAFALRYFRSALSARVLARSS